MLGQIRGRVGRGECGLVTGAIVSGPNGSATAIQRPTALRCAIKQKGVDCSIIGAIMEVGETKEYDIMSWTGRIAGRPDWEVHG